MNVDDLETGDIVLFHGNYFIEEAINLLPENMVERAKSYWYSHIMCAINDDHEFIGGSLHHMQNSLDEWIEQCEDKEDNNRRIRTWMCQADEDDWLANNPYRPDDDE